LSSAAGAPLGGFMLGIEAAEVPFVGSKYDYQFPPVLSAASAFFPKLTALQNRLRGGRGLKSA
jgi:hypothetical protein